MINEKIIEIKFCPKCKGENIGVDATITANDYCIDCDYNNSKMGLVSIVNFPIKTKKMKETEK